MTNDVGFYVLIGYVYFHGGQVSSIPLPTFLIKGKHKPGWVAQAERLQYQAQPVQFGDLVILCIFISLYEFEFLCIDLSFQLEEFLLIFIAGQDD